MNKYTMIFLTLFIALFTAASCAADIEKVSAATSGAAPPETPAVSFSDTAKDPPEDLPAEITGIVKEIEDALVLVEIPGKGSEYRLRFSETTEWGAGINTEITVGSRIVCVVRPDPVREEPPRGEVLRIIRNVSPE